MSPTETRIVLERPTLILIMGIAGTGKTTLARRLLTRVSAAYLDKDTLADAFFPETIDAARYVELRPALYRALYTIAEENLRAGNSVVLDAPHVKQVQIGGWRRWLKDLVARADAGLAVIRCGCNGMTIRRRLVERGEARDLWKLENWEEFVRHEPPLVPIPFDHLELDTEDDLDANVERAFAYVVRAGRRRPVSEEPRSRLPGTSQSPISKPQSPISNQSL